MATAPAHTCSTRTHSAAVMARMDQIEACVVSNAPRRSITLLRRRGRCERRISCSMVRRRVADQKGVVAYFNDASDLPTEAAARSGRARERQPHKPFSSHRH